MAEAEFSAVAKFLAPVLKRDSIAKARGDSLIDSLSTQIDSTLSNKTEAVIRDASSLLLNIHNALCKLPPNQASSILYSPESKRAVDGLLDLISLEAIYPHLLPGVGVPIERRVNSILRTGVVSQPSGDSDVRSEDGVLLDVVTTLHGIATSVKKGIWPLFVDRTLVDLVAAELQLVHTTEGERSGSYRNMVDSLSNG